MTFKVKAKMTQDGDGKPWTIRAPDLAIDATENERERAERRTFEEISRAATEELGDNNEVVCVHTVVTKTFAVRKRDPTKATALTDFERKEKPGLSKTFGAGAGAQEPMTVEEMMKHDEAKVYYEKAVAERESYQGDDPEVIGKLDWAIREAELAIETLDRAIREADLAQRGGNEMKEPPKAKPRRIRKKEKKEGE